MSINYFVKGPETTSKIGVKEVIILWTELNHHHDVPLRSIREANKWIKSYSDEFAEEGEGYAKTKFKVVFEDGDDYTGRLDLTYKDRYAPNLIGDHMKDYLEFLGGLKKPSHFTDEQYAEFDSQEARDFLKLYDLENK